MEKAVPGSRQPVVAGLDTTDLYGPRYEQEMRDFRRIIGNLLRQIFLRNYVDTGFLARTPAEAVLAAETWPTVTAHVFSARIVAYFEDSGLLQRSADGHFVPAPELVDADPHDAELDAFLAAHPESRRIYGFLRNVRDVMGQVIFGGEDSFLSLIFDDFRESMNLWTDLMAYASVKEPCQAFVARALAQRLARGGAVDVFEGGAGVGAVLRKALDEPGFAGLCDHLRSYVYTDLSFGLVKVGRNWLREHAPPALLERTQFTVCNLDQLEGEAPYLQDDSLDLVLLENVLHDVTDLHYTLSHLRRMLRPDGWLVVSCGYRVRPRDFFMFEFMQSSFGSYYHAKLEPGFRDQAGWLSLREWQASLERAGFAPPEVHPPPSEHTRFPLGGFVARPDK